MAHSNHEIVRKLSGFHELHDASRRTALTDTPSHARSASLRVAQPLRAPPTHRSPAAAPSPSLTGSATTPALRPHYLRTEPARLHRRQRAPLHCQPNRTTSGLLAVIGSLIGFGLTPYFAVQTFNAGVSAEAAAMWRTALPAIICLPAIRGLRRWRTEALIAAALGAFTAVGFTTFYRALEQTPVAAATLVYYTYPAFALALGWMFFHVRFRARDAAAVFLVTCGAAAALGPTSLDRDALLVLGISFLAPLSWGLFLLLLSGRLAPMPIGPKMLASFAGGGIVMVPLTLWHQGTEVIPPNGQAVVAIIALTVVTRALPGLLVSVGAPHVGGLTTGIVGSGEFLVALGAGWILLGEQILAMQLVGAGLIAAGAISATLPVRARAKRPATIRQRAALRRPHTEMLGGVPVGSVP